jgi:hypothetical protein
MFRPAANMMTQPLAIMAAAKATDQPVIPNKPAAAP